MSARRLARSIAGHSRAASLATLAVLAVAAAGGTATYALTGGGRTIKACIHRHGGGLYVAKRCAGHDRRVSWNQIGPRGLQGVPGPGAQIFSTSLPKGTTSPASLKALANGMTVWGECGTTGVVAAVIGPTSTGDLTQEAGVLARGGTMQQTSEVGPPLGFSDPGSILFQGVVRDATTNTSFEHVEVYGQGSNTSAPCQFQGVILPG